MNKSILALTVLVAIGFFAPSAQAGFLCEDDDGEMEICLKRLPLKSLLPRALPGLPTPVGVSRDDDDDDEVVVVPPRAMPKTLAPEIRMVEKPATLGMPDIERVCKKYFSHLGEMLPIPCDD